MLLKSASKPTAVLLEPVVRLKSALKPMAVLSVPLVRLRSELSPSAVFWPGYPPSGGGITARAVGESAKQASANVRRKPSRKDDLQIDFPECRVVIFFVFIFLLRLLFYRLLSTVCGAV